MGININFIIPDKDNFFEIGQLDGFEILVNIEFWDCRQISFLKLSKYK